MADYFVASGGSNTSPYDTWAKAATSLATALAAATTAGDRVVIQYDGVPSGDAELAADTSYTVAGSIQVISSTNSGTSTITPTAMGTANWIGNSTTNRAVRVAGSAAKSSYWYGVTFRTAGSSLDNLHMAQDAGHYVFDNCYFWTGNTTAAGALAISTTGAGRETFVEFLNSTIRFADVGQKIDRGGATVLFRNCVISTDGAAITTLIYSGNLSGGTVTFDGCDLSYVNTTLVGDSAGGQSTYAFINCKLPASYVAMASQTAVGIAGAEVFLYDCYSGDEHVHIGHYNGFGETTIATGIYANDNIADSNLSWKIVGTATATAKIPYVSPWISVYHTGTSAITPYLEICRSGSATAYNNNEVFAEFAYKGTSGSTKATFVNDGMALLGSPAAQANSSKGASDWTGENATSWFGKIDSGSSITPAEVGHIRARVCVAGANTVYVDPQIRGLS